MEDFGKVYAYTISPSLKVIKDKKMFCVSASCTFLYIERDQNVPFSVKSTYSIYFIKGNTTVLSLEKYIMFVHVLKFYICYVKVEPT